MRILSDLSAEVPDTNVHHWNLEEYSEQSDKDALLYGYNASENTQLQENHSNFKRKIYFNNWAPCEFAQDRANDFNALFKEKWFNEIYSICPYTSQWMNQVTSDREYKSIFYPFHKSIIPDETTKKYEFCLILIIDIVQ